MKVTFKTGSEANYGSTNGELFFASNTKQIMLNGIKYIPKKLSELTNDSGFLTSISKSMVENVLTGNITSHTHSYLPLSGGTLTGNLILPNNKQITTGGLVIDHNSSGSCIVYKNSRINPSGGWWADEIITVKDSTDNLVFEFGMFGRDTTLNYAYLGTNPYTGDNFRIYSDKLTFGNNVIYHAGNLNKSIIESVLTGNITSHTHSYLPLTGGTLTGAITAATFNGSLNGNATSASKLETPRKITIGSTYKSFDGSGDIEFALNSIITQSDTINVGTLNVAEQLTTDKIEVKNNLTISSGADISGLTPSMIGAAAASHTHSYIVTEGDNRSVATTPNDYSNNFVFKGLKSNSQIGSPTTDSYSYLLGLRGWYNSSGGQSHELAFNNSGVYRRQGATTEWGSWYKILDSGNFNSYAATKDHTHTFASLTSKPTTLNGYGITDAYTKTETNTELGKYLPLTGGTLTGTLTLTTLTSTGGILLGDSSLSAMIGSIGIQRYDETGFIGFLKDFDLSNSFNGVVLGWDGNYQLSTNSVRIDASTFTYKGNSVLHSGNLGYTSSGLSRAVQKDTNGNLFIVAPSLFEQGISNNYPKNLRWSNETEGQLVYDKEIAAGNFDTVEIGIPLAGGTSKGFLKSTSTITNVTGYTPCPVVSGTPYYKEDCLYLGSTEIGYTGIMEYGIQYTFNYGTKHSYLENYTPDSIPRCVVLCFPDRSSNNRFLFWLSAFDEEDPYIARFYNSAYETWLTIDTVSRQIILSYGDTWQSQ